MREIIEEFYKYLKKIGLTFPKTAPNHAAISSATIHSSIASNGSEASGLRIFNIKQLNIIDQFLNTNQIFLNKITSYKNFQWAREKTPSYCLS